MGFYLETVKPLAVSEIGQYVSLKGVVCPIEEILQEKPKVSEMISSLLDVMSDQQSLLLPALSAGFRALFAEARTTAAISPSIVVMIPGTAEGLMCVKACNTLKVPCILDNTDSVLMAAFVHENHGTQVLMDYSKLEQTCDPVKAISAVSSKYPEMKVLVRGFSNQGQINKVLEACDADIVLEYKLACEMFYHPASLTHLDNLRMDWVNEFMRVELTGDETEEVES